MEKRYATYQAFWPHYVSEHRGRVTRLLHFVGTSLVLASLALGFLASPWFFLAAPFCGYGSAWVGHFVFERNRPATFRYPLWSLAADFHMYFLMCTGRMEREVKRMSVLQE